MSILFTIVALLALFLFTVLIILCKRTIVPRCCKPIQTLFQVIERKLLFNSVLRAILEVYLATCITMFHGFKSARTYTELEKISYLFGLATAIFCFYFPFWTFNLLRKNADRLSDPHFSGRFNSLYQNLDVEKYEAHPFTLVFCLRRLLFAYAITSLDRTLVFQVFFIDGTSTFILCYYITCKPMKNTVNNAIHIFNELVILSCTWYLFLFTNYVPDPILRYDLAVYFLYVIGVNMGVNIFLLIVIILH